MLALTDYLMARDACEQLFKTGGAGAVVLAAHQALYGHEGEQGITRDHLDKLAALAGILESAYLTAREKGE